MTRKVDQAPPTELATNAGPALVPSSGMAKWVGLFIVVMTLVVGSAIAVPAVGRSQGWLVDAGTPSLPAGVLTPTAPATAGPGAGVIDPAPAHSAVKSAQAGQLAARLAVVPKAVNATVTGQVIDLGSGEVLWDQAGSKVMIPASSIKILTAISVIDAIGPDATFRTKVVTGADGQIILVGGGDPMLTAEPPTATGGYPTAPNMADLAKATAEALKAKGATAVTLGWDDSLFTGPSWHPQWIPAYATAVTRISSLWVDQGQGADGKRSATPAQSAAETFAAQLRANGLAVTLNQAMTPAPSGAPELAGLDSLPLLQITQAALLQSDNSITEVLLRHLAIAKGKPGSFVGGAEAMAESLRALDLWTPGESVQDGSGLSKQNLISAQSLAKAVVLASRRDDLRALITALPTGSATGTLIDRFEGPGAEAARGWVRAKTGTLSQIGSLTGYTRTVDGSLLAFSIIGNGNTEGDLRAYLDQWTAALTSCGCA